MKKFLSVFLTIVLLIAATPLDAFSFGASAECGSHVYANACDTVCNECGAEREYTIHNYSNCFAGCEENIDYSGEWKKTPAQTAVYGINPIAESESFTYHYLVVTDKNGSEVKFDEKTNGWPLVKEQEYTIRLKCQYDDTPVSDIVFTLVEITDTLYPDTHVDTWYNDPITYVTGRGLMTGYGSNGYFGTADDIQRQDFLVMLARFDGVDLSGYADKSSNFPDVAKDSYYEAAVIWGYENGIVTGYENGKFGVEDKITREQLVTIFYRYAQNVKGLDVSCAPEQKDDVKNSYTDYNDVTDYAEDSIIWAVTRGIIKGQADTAIAPHSNALRCEVAQIMYNNYLNNIIPDATLCIHNYSDATCTTPKTCTKCGETRGSALGHDYVAGECVRKNNGETCGDFSESYCPKLYLTGDMDKITDPNQRDKKIECSIDFEYRSSDQIVNGAAKIKIQGSSSTQYAKKNYTINFYENSDYSSKKKIDVGWGAQSKYCLKANWIDKTHSRNVVSAKLAGEMQAKYGLFESAPNNGAVDGFPVEVYINGEFHGLYTMNIPKDEWQFNMDKDNPNHIVICGDNWNDPVLFKSIPENLNDWTVEVGPEDDATLAKVQRLVDFVMNSSDEEFKQNFDQYLNLDSTLNYYVMMNMAYMTDNVGKNMLLATYDGEVWYPSLYDLDTSWGTTWQGTGLQGYENGLMSAGRSTLWARMEELYSKEIAERYFELRGSVLSEEHIMDTFNSFYDTIPTEVLEREYEKWNTEETPLPGYDFTQISSYLISVFPRLDAKYETWR